MAWKKSRGVALLAPIAALLACDGAAPERAPAVNVVIAVIDTLRVDHLSTYGYARPTSPHLDRLAEESLVFEQAFTVMGHTLPAHVSLLTGLHPGTHHVRSNGSRYRGAFPTLAERLRRRGYATAAFVSGLPLARGCGLSRGFQVYRDSARGERGRPQAKIDGEQTNARVLRWLDQRDEGPFFLFVHYYDAHPPYTRPRAQGLTLSPDAALDRHLASIGAAGRRMQEVSPVPPTLDGRVLGLREAVNVYDNEIRRVDALVEELRAELERRDLLDDTLFIVTADHGEGLGQHGFYSHGVPLFEEELHIPLIVRPPGRSGWQPARIPAVVSLLDVVPTVLELTGLPVDDRLHGESLSRALAADRLRAPRALLMERRHFSPAAHAELGPRFAPVGTLHALRGDFRFKYLLGSDGREALFDLRADPMERHDLAAERPAESARMRARLLELRAERSVAGAMPAPELDAATRESLRSLGYVP